MRTPIIVSKFPEPAPCRNDCPNRSPACHTAENCEAYKEWRLRKEGFNQRVEEQEVGLRTSAQQLWEGAAKQVKKRRRLRSGFTGFL